LVPAADKVVPGKPYLIDASQRAKQEAFIRKQREDFDRAPAQLMYQDPLE
jgi:hypothetical protein